MPCLAAGRVSGCGPPNATSAGTTRARSCRKTAGSGTHLHARRCSPSNAERAGRAERLPALVARGLDGDLGRVALHFQDSDDQLGIGQAKSGRVQLDGVRALHLGIRSTPSLAPKPDRCRSDHVGPPADRPHPPGRASHWTPPVRTNMTTPTSIRATITSVRMAPRFLLIGFHLLLQARGRRRPAYWPASLATRPSTRCFTCEWISTAYALPSRCQSRQAITASRIRQRRSFIRRRSSLAVCRVRAFEETPDGVTTNGVRTTCPSSIW